MSRILKFVILGLFGIWCLGFDASAEARTVFFGVFREGAPANINHIKNFESQTGKKPEMVMWYQDWAQNFPFDAALNAIKYGAVPHIVWEPWYWGDHSKVQLKDIVAGKWDAYITSWAQEIRNFKYPVYLRLAHEFNIEAYPWGIVNNDKDPKNYIEAFRHVVNIFKKEKVGNAIWVWCPMNFSYPDEPWNDWAAAYPGDEYVDWIGIDGYNWGKSQPWSDWQSFSVLFRDQARRARKLWPNKPIMVAEFAAAEQGGDKAAWIREIPNYLKSSMREIDLIVWFDIKKEADWQVKSSKKSEAAFKATIKDPIFNGSYESFSRFVFNPPKRVKKTMLAVRSRGAVKIDARLTEWDKGNSIVFEDAESFKEGLNWEGVADLSGCAYLMWDNENLYLAAEVTDRNPLVSKWQKSDIWKGDGIEITLGVNPKADPNRENMDKGDYQIGFGAGNGKDNLPSIWNWQRRRTPKGSEIAVAKNKNGYVLEAKVPWSFFGESFTPAKGMKLGFDLAFDDADSSGERECQFIWNGDYGFYKDPSVWGILELI